MAFHCNVSMARCTVGSNLGFTTSPERMKLKKHIVHTAHSSASLLGCICHTCLVPCRMLGMIGVTGTSILWQGLWYGSTGRTSPVVQLRTN